jgi:hypothetical protein
MAQVGTGFIKPTTNMNNQDTVLSDLKFATMTMTAGGVTSTAASQNPATRTVFGTANAASCTLTNNGFVFKDGNGQPIGGPQPPGLTNVQGVEIQDNGVVAIYTLGGVDHPFAKSVSLLDQFDALGKAIEELQVKNEQALRAVESQYKRIRTELAKLLSPSFEVHVLPHDEYPAKR